MSKILEQNVVMLFFRSRCCCCHLICFHFLFTKTKIVICLQTAKHLLCQAAIQSLKQSVSLSVAIFCLNKNLYIVFVRKFHFISQLLIVSTKCSYVTLKTQTQTDEDTNIHIYTTSAFNKREMIEIFRTSLTDLSLFTLEASKTLMELMMPRIIQVQTLP